MSSPPRRMTQEEYDRAAQAYLESLPLEHFMEATSQSTQREVSVAAFALLRARLPDFHYFGELLVQYFYEGNLRQVVPDNMVVLGPLGQHKRTNFATEHEPSSPFWMLEYVSASNKRKDYVDSFAKYEREMKVPYYLIYDPDEEDLRLYRHNGALYLGAERSAAGRPRLPELELEVSVVDGWVRYWHRGEMLPLPAELQERVEQLDEQLRARDEQVRRQEEQLRQRDEQLKRLRRDEQRRAEELRQRGQELDALVGALRPLVEARARAAGRQDILERLPATTDGGALSRWLAELG